MELQGRIIDGRYEVESVLGRGGMGVVVKARHRFTGARVAVKLLHPHLIQGDLGNRFLAEAQAPAAIGHPGIVSISDAGVTPDGELYLVMELLEGDPLRDVLKQRRPTLSDVKRICGELLAALGAAHAAGFIHRDLKPENIFITRNGTVKLLDFGIAKILAEGIDSKGQTAAGSMMGTLAYMSPEQLRDARTVDARTDLWAVGVILYEMLTGALPYNATSFGNMVLEVMSKPPTPLATWVVGPPPEVDAAVTRALARDPAGRFQSAAEMAGCTASFPSVEAPLAPRASAPMLTVSPIGPTTPAMFVSQQALLTPAAVVVQTAAPPPTSRKGTALLIAGGIAAAAAIGIIVGVVAAGHKPPPKELALAATPTSSAPAQDPSPAPAPAPTPVPVPVTASAPVSSAATTSAHGKVTTPPVVITVARSAPVTMQIPVPVTTSAAVAPPPPPPPPAQRTDAEVCAAGCSELKSCGIYVDSSCQSACMSSPLNIACARRSSGCAQAAACVFASVCNGTGPVGGNSCAVTAGCEAGCGNNGGCLCRCAQAMSADHAALLLQLNDCGLSCNGDPSCMQQKCPNTINRCRSE